MNNPLFKKLKEWWKKKKKKKMGDERSGSSKKDSTFVEQNEEYRIRQQAIKGGSSKIDSILVEQYEEYGILQQAIKGGSSKIDSISIKQYEEERKLQQAIMASIHHTNGIICLSDEEDEIKEIKLSTPFGDRPITDPSVMEAVESSNSKPSIFICEICCESKFLNDLFLIKGCIHSYCKECMITYVASKIQENITLIECPEPNCEGILKPEFCRSILPSEVFDRWGNALCESLILGSQKFYCPFKDCSALLLDDGGEIVKQSVCPNCHRMFCAQCKVPWHSGINCAGFKKLNDERGRQDIMFMKLAKKRKWQRCPRCSFYIEKSEGCLSMKCRCGFAFCYRCGSPLGYRTAHRC